MGIKARSYSFLMKQALARGFISKEKSELAKVIKNGG
jgi:hypothetical protein